MSHDEKWLELQKKLTEETLQLTGGRAAIAERLRELYDYDHFLYPIERGPYQFFFHRPAGKDHFIFCRSDRDGSNIRPLIDPNQFPQGEAKAVTRARPDPNGRYVAFATSHSGSDWQTWQVMDAKTGELLEDVIAGVKFSLLSWRHDEPGFFYCSFAETVDKFGANSHHKVFYHRLQAKQHDQLIYFDPDHPDYHYFTHVSNCGRYLVLIVESPAHPGNLVLCKDLNRVDAPWQKYVNEFGAHYVFVGSDGGSLYFRTDDGASRGRVLAFALVSSDIPPREVIGERDQVLERVSLIGDRILVSYTEHALTQVLAFDGSGNLQGKVPLPGKGTAYGFEGHGGSETTYFNYTDFMRPATVFRYVLKSGELQVHYQPRLKFNPREFQVKQLFVKSFDQTQIPVFLVGRQDVLEAPEPSPLLLYAYGGFGVTMKPSFSPLQHHWMEQGGLYAVCGVRGGGEYGEHWHRSGSGEHKLNTIRDVEACAQFFLHNNYCTRQSLALFGRSNGAMVMAAVVNRDPTLYQAAILVAGLYDMLNFHRYTIGKIWQGEYGNSEDPIDKARLEALSPLHNIQAGQIYPHIMVCTGRDDDRVPPLHSYQLVKALQEKTQKPSVILNLYDKTGHGAGRSTSQTVAEHADILSFAMAAVGLGESSLSSR